MSKTRAEINAYQDAEYVVAHADRQRQRGRNPSVAYNGIKNPREALAAAQDELAMASLEYGEANRYIFKIEPPVEIRASALRELLASDNGPIEDREIGDRLPLGFREPVRLAQMEDLAALALIGPDSWGSPDFEAHAGNILVDMCQTTDHPEIVAKRFTGLFDGDHIVTYEPKLSTNNIMGNQNCW